MQRVTAEAISELPDRERRRFKEYVRSHLDRQYYRNLRERAIAQQRAEQEIEDDSTRDFE